jgi:hypothetical protein
MPGARSEKVESGFRVNALQIIESEHFQCRHSARISLKMLWSAFRKVESGFVSENAQIQLPRASNPKKSNLDLSVSMLWNISAKSGTAFYGQSVRMPQSGFDSMPGDIDANGPGDIDANGQRAILPSRKWTAPSPGVGILAQTGSCPGVFEIRTRSVMA